jgi:hypothetical protein
MGQSLPEGSKETIGLPKPREDAPVFRMNREERDLLIEADQDTFFVTDHYRAHRLVPFHPERRDCE